MNVEKKRMEVSVLCEEGHITLEKLAIPETMEIRLLGKKIIPKSFDDYGHPNFTEEQVKFFIYQEEEIKRSKDKDKSLTLEILYEERPFNVSRNEFDTLSKIEESLESFQKLDTIIRNRKIFFKLYSIELNEFVIFGYIKLNKFGDVQIIDEGKKTTSNKDVEYYEIFKKNKKIKEYFRGIPSYATCCPCCGNRFTITDVKSRAIENFDNVYYHTSCWYDFRRLEEIHCFTKEIMDFVYEEYKIEIIENETLAQSKYSSCIPWVLFHTMDGDIILGRKYTNIFVEWQENYKSFNMKSIGYKKEDVFDIWKEEGKRGICVTDANIRITPKILLIEYLNTAREIVKG